jgi:acetate kinase
VTPARCVLTINSGSSSIKFAVFPLGASEPVLKGKTERIGLDRSGFEAVDAAGKQVAHAQQPLPDHESALKLVLATAQDATPHSLVAVGHRVVRGGAEDTDPQPVTRPLLKRIRELIPYLPEHLPHQVAAIEAVERFDASLQQVVCFDTAFHRTMPRIAQLYALPRDLLNAGILRYGFHGLSYEYVVGEFARLTGEKTARERVVIAHLGNGCSMAAIRGGRSIDTTMGFTPTGGVMMSSRSGDLDPGVVLFLLQHQKLSATELSDILNRKSGLAGVSGGSPDMRDLLAREATDPYAAEAIELFCYQVKKYLGALAAVLGGLDALIFTAGIGENVPEIRRRICEGMGHLGLVLDARANDANAPLISSKEATASIRVIPTNEELMIARHTVSVISRTPC